MFEGKKERKKKKNGHANDIRILDIDGKGSAVKYFVSLEMVRQVETDIYFDVIRKNVILHNDITIILFLNRESESDRD